MGHRGAGAPPPRRSSGGGKNDRAIHYLSETVHKADGTPQQKQIKPLKMWIGVKNHPILTLDDFLKLEDAYSVNLHIFNLRGTKDNIVVCPMTADDPRPCPVCEALNKDPTWYVVLSAIDRKVYEFERQNRDTKAMEKVQYFDLRRLVLITQSWIPRMDTNADRAKGWRGSLFEVSRSEPTKTVVNGQERLSYKDSPRMGDVWYFTEKYDEEKLRSELEKGAAAYGMPVERFIQPVDYETVLKPKTHQELQHVANDIASDGSAVKQPSGGGTAVAASTPSSSDAEAEINY